MYIVHYIGCSDAHGLEATWERRVTLHVDAIDWHIHDPLFTQLDGMHWYRCVMRHKWLRCSQSCLGMDIWQCSSCISWRFYRRLTIPLTDQLNLFPWISLVNRPPLFSWISVVNPTLYRHLVLLPLYSLSQNVGMVSGWENESSIVILILKQKIHTTVDFCWHLSCLLS
jgi:hypothetical protein